MFRNLTRDVFRIGFALIFLLAGKQGQESNPPLPHAKSRTFAQFYIFGTDGLARRSSFPGYQLLRTTEHNTFKPKTTFSSLTFASLEGTSPQKARTPGRAKKPRLTNAKLNI